MVHLNGKPHYIIADIRIITYLTNRVKESYEYMCRMGYTNTARSIYPVYIEMLHQLLHETGGVIDDPEN